MDLVNETISWLQNGEPVTGGSGGSSDGVLNRPLVQLLANDNGLQDRIDIIADDSGYVKKTIDSTKIGETTSGTTARVQIDAAGLKQYDGTNKTVDFDESGNVTVGYDANNKMTLAAGVLEALLNRLQIIASGNSGLSLNNSTGDAISIAGAGVMGIDIENATQYGLRIGNCTGGGYGPLHIINAGVAGAANLHTTYASAAVDTIAVDSNHDPFIKTGTSTWTKIGATAASEGPVSSANITSSLVQDNSVIVDQDGLTMRKAAGAVRFDVNEDGSWKLGNAAGANLDFTTGDVMTLTSATLTSCSIAGEEINSGTVAAARIASLDASKITTGTFDAARIPSLDASKITTGTLGTDRIPSLDASKITTGTFADARIPSLDAAKITTGIFDTARIPSLDASKITTGTLGTDRIPSLDAAKITSGTFATARIPDLDGSKITSGDITLDTSGQQFRAKGYSSTSTGFQMYGTTYQMNWWCQDTGYNQYLTPSSDTNQLLNIGSASPTLRWNDVNVYVSDTFLVTGGNIVKFTSSTNDIVLTGDVFRPDNTSGDLDLGASSYPFDTLYCKSINMVDVMTIPADAGGANKITYSGSTNDFSIYPYGSNNNTFYMRPSADNVSELRLGYTGYRLSYCSIYSYGKIDLYVTGSGTHGVQVDNAAFYPYSTAEDDDCGTSTHGWDYVYRVNEAAPAEMFFMDDRKDLITGKVQMIDDLEILNSVKPRVDKKGKPVYDKRTGYRLVDDSSLPDWLFVRDKKDKKTILKNKKGQPFYNVDAMVQLCAGGIRRLYAKFVEALETINSLNERIVALEEN